MPPFGHCIPGIHSQVKQHLFNLSGVSDDHSNMRRKVKIKGNIFPYYPCQDFCQIFDDLIQINRPHVEYLFTAERQELAGQNRCFFPGFFYCCDILAQFTVRGQVTQGKFTVTDNCRQNIIKVMGNTTGKAPDRLHFLYLIELCLQLELFLLCSFTVTDITDHMDNSDNLIVFINPREGFYLQMLLKVGFKDLGS